MKKFLTIASAMIAVATLYVTAQGITLDDVPYNTPMWSQQDPFGFDTMNVVTVDLSKIKGDIVVITNDMSNIKGTMAVVTNDIKGVKGTMAVVTNDIATLKLYGPRITALEAFTNTVDVASYVKKNEGNGVGSDFLLFGNTGTRSFSIGYHGFGVNQSYDDYDFESFSGPQGINFEKRSKTTWEEHITWYKDYMIFMMYTSPSGTVGDGREYTLPEGPSSRIATLHDVVSATGGIVTVESDPVALPLLATHTNSAGIHLTPTQATRIANSVLGSEIPDYLRNLPAVTNWSFSASGANKSMSFNSQTGLLFSDEVANVSYLLNCFGLAMLSDNGGGSVSFKLDGIRVSDTLYGYPSGVASDIATKADIATAVAGLDPEEKDLKALRLYHYGDPDIEPSPAEWFNFSDGVITGFNYQAGREHVVIPWEINGQAVVEIGTDFIDMVETVIAPKSVLRLADYAFAYNDSVVSVDFPAVTNAGYVALAYCKNLKHINLPSIVVVPELYRCAAKSLSFPSASRVTYNAINDCTNLVELTFGGAVKPTFDADWNTYGTHPDLKIYVTNPYATGWDGITEVDGTPVVRVVNTDMIEDLIPDVDLTELTDPYQDTTATLTVVSGTATVVRASGLYPKLALTDNTVLTVDGSTFPDTGTASFKVVVELNGHDLDIDTTDSVLLSALPVFTGAPLTLLYERALDGRWVVMPMSEDMAEQDDLAPIYHAVVSKPAIAGKTTFILQPGQTTYETTISDDIEIEFDSSNLSFTGREARFKLRLDVEEYDKEMVFTGIEFVHDLEILCPGVWEFDVSTVDGVSYKAVQTFPEVYEWGSFTYLNKTGTGGSWVSSLQRAAVNPGQTNTVYFSAPSMAEYILVRPYVTVNLNKPVTFEVGLVLANVSVDIKTRPDNTIGPVTGLSSGQGITPLFALKRSLSDSIGVWAANISEPLDGVQSLFVFSYNARARSMNANEIKAYENGWRPSNDTLHPNWK